jgi:acyl-CoA synthetase (AMP-forming)/AMP-acid ligase II
MRGLMQHDDLTIHGIFERAVTFHPRQAIVTKTPAGIHRETYEELGERVSRLANALRSLGVGPGDRVGSFGFNTVRHLELYMAVPSMASVLHTLNVRLHPDQVAWIVNHAEDRVVFVDDVLLPAFAKVVPQLTTVEHVVVMGSSDAGERPERALDYEELVAGSSPDFDWPKLSEDDASAMCYTSGTTGNPKGVVYSHRSTFLHTMGVLLADSLGARESDRILPVVPMFHANAWGLAHAAVACGADLVMPGADLSGKALADLIVEERVTIAAGVPTIWMQALPELKGRDTSRLRTIPCGGSAVSKALSESYREAIGLPILQAWGMTETSPVATVGRLDGDQELLRDDEKAELRTTVGRAELGVDCRIVEPGTTTPVPRNGISSGELQCRGPWIAASYYNDERAGESFTDDGWLRTGDVATMDERGRIKLVDRTKDLIKSGGEWISSVEIENELMGHPEIREAAVIGVVDQRWGERPLACVVKVEGSELTEEAVLGFIAPHLAKWQLPDRVVFIDEVPKTSVGKFSKKTLRDRYPTMP